MRGLVLFLALVGACGEKLERNKKPEVSTLVDTAEQDTQAAPLIEQTRAKTERALAERQEACVALGRIGGNAARGRLVEVLTHFSQDPKVDGPMHLYAAAGLTVLNDAGTAVDLVLSLSTINPNDNIAALASEERSEEYYPIDAQICDALLGMGLLQVEDDLVLQLRRRDRIRVLIDAHAVLRRRTGKDLPYRYNGSYAARIEDADAWQEWLTRTRAERSRQLRFDTTDALFQLRFQEVVNDLGTDVMNNLLIARKVVMRFGEYAAPFLIKALRSDNPTWQREGALMLGRIRATSAAADLRAAVKLDNAKARVNALDALRLIGEAGAVGIAVDALKDGDPGVRASAARFLGAHGTGAELAALTEAAKEERLPDTRAAMDAAMKAVKGK